MTETVREIVRVRVRERVREREIESDKDKEWDTIYYLCSTTLIRIPRVEPGYVLVRKNRTVQLHLTL